MLNKKHNILQPLIKKAEIIREVKLCYSIQGSGSPVLLIHGWPQTQDAWRYLVPLLTENHTVITVDLPGIGGSSPSKMGYSKRELARYIRELLLKLNYHKVTVIGHDIGGQVAYAYAKEFTEEVQSVVVIDVPIPGMPGWEQERGKWPRWHFAFHQQKDLPEILVRNNVASYLNYFFQGLSYNKGALNTAEVAPYIEAYSNEASLHAGFELYRAFDQDAEENQKGLSSKLKIPLLAIGGEYSRMKNSVSEQFEEVAEHLTWKIAPASGHYVPEEAPDWLAKTVIKFAALTNSPFAEL